MPATPEQEAMKAQAAIFEKIVKATIKQRLENSRAR
jgi:hypothetical protein